jgi:hypothetical protein
MAPISMQKFKIQKFEFIFPKISNRWRQILSKILTPKILIYFSKNFQEMAPISKQKFKHQNSNFFSKNFQEMALISIQKLKHQKFEFIFLKSFQ